MKQKILFTDLLKSHSDSEIKLKIDNEYIYRNEIYIFFKNIDFSFQCNNAEVTANDIPNHVYLYDNDTQINFDEVIGISFEYCNFTKEIPSLNTNLIYLCNSQHELNARNDILFKECHFTNLVNKLPNIQGGKIKHLLISNKIWENKFYINKQHGNNSRKTILLFRI